MPDIHVGNMAVKKDSNFMNDFNQEIHNCWTDLMISYLISNHYMYIDLVELLYTYDPVATSCPVYSLTLDF